MRALARVASLVSVLSLTPACVPTTYYRWGGYDDALYTHYKSPQDRAPLIAQLKSIIQDAEQGGGRVPPGIYAEYGFALYEEGQIADAVTYFGKERDAWPESRAFMEKMIRNAQNRQGTTVPAQGPAGALEGRSNS